MANFFPAPSWGCVCRAGNCRYLTVYPAGMRYRGGAGGLRAEWRTLEWMFVNAAGGGKSSCTGLGDAYPDIHPHHRSQTPPPISETDNHFRDEEFR